MFRLRVIQAEFGDCFVLEFGTAKQPRFILIDGGPPHTFDDHLRAELEAIAKRNRTLDLALLSHVDNDHIVGLVDYFAELQAGGDGLPRPKELWHNSWVRSIDPDGTIAPRLKALMTASRTAAMPNATNATLGITEGSALRAKANLLNLPINKSVPATHLITVDDVSKPITFGNLTLRIVAPTKKNLDKLRKEWVEWLEQQENDVAKDDPMVMANSDRSVPNLSSIAVIAKAHGKTLLLTGDGRSDHLLEGLEMAGQLDKKGHMHVDVLKLAHHGSELDVTPEFFERVGADTYVVSANGRYGNPDYSTLTWIVEAAKAAGRRIKLILTNQTPADKQLKKKYAPAKYRYSIDYMPKGDHSLVLSLSR
jgi:beta-lactamase superfamily II metal-dependent hydrolase